MLNFLGQPPLSKSTKGTGALLSKSHSYIFLADVKCIHDSGRGRDWVLRRMTCHLGCELREENLKTEGACTVMKRLRKEDWGSKERNMG